MKVEIGQVVKQSRARSTGETIIVKFDGKKTWVAKSVQTGEFKAFETRRAAEIAMSKPETWSETSAKITRGDLPKYGSEKGDVA
jgi:hypothetical protein